MGTVSSKLVKHIGVWFRLARFLSHIVSAEKIQGKRKFIKNENNVILRNIPRLDYLSIASSVTHLHNIETSGLLMKQHYRISSFFPLLCLFLIKWKILT